MNALRDAMSHAVLGWVKPELDETLRQARTEVEAFAEYPADTSRMRFCAGYLHQVQGTLRMVELYAPAMVAEEMELLAQALQDGSVADRDEACATLMRGTVLLPDYLERLQNGHRDIPIVLLPLLNEIRAARGAAGLSESVLFAPDLNRPLPEQVADAPVLPVPQREDGFSGALEAFDLALADWPQNAAPAATDGLAAAAAGLLEHGEPEAMRRMLWVLSSAADALRDGALEADDALRAAFAGVSRAVHQARASEGQSMPQGIASQEPTRQLLYLVAQSRVAHPGLDALREAFELDVHAPSQDELDHARGSLAGRNRSLLDTVGGVVKEELMRVKDALDLHLRTGGDAASLEPQAGELARVADTLGMLGLGVARDVVQQQREALEAIARGQQPASESALLDIAGALLYVDASLDDQVARLGAPSGGAGEDTAALEARRTIEVLAHEAISNFAAAREQFVAFIETNWDHARLHDVPRLLEEVAGALRILDLGQPAGYLDAVRRYVSVELIGRLRVPSGRQLDTLADAMASLEYYLEALRDRRPNRDGILEIAHSSLEALGYWPPQAEHERVPDPVADTARQPEPQAGLVQSAPPAIAATVPSLHDAAVEPGSDATAADSAPSVAAADAGTGLSWDTVAAEPVIAFDQVDESADWVIAPVLLDGPEREPIALPELEIELPAFVPDTVEAPSSPGVLDTLDITFDPVDAEYEQTASTDGDWSVLPFDPVAAVHGEDSTDAAATGEPGTVFNFDPVAAELEVAEPSAPAEWTLDPQASVAAASEADDGVAAEASFLDEPAADAVLDATDVVAALDDTAEAAAEVAGADADVAADAGAGDVPEAVGTSIQEPAVQEPVQASPLQPGQSGQWLDLTVQLRQNVRPAQVYESRSSHLDVDAGSSSLISEIAAAAAQLPGAFSATPPADASDVAPAAAAEVPSASAPMITDVPVVASGFDESEGIDAEIREVFLEEFDEELQNLAQLLPAWRAAPADTERLRPIRRVFHTLKGSGRLVGARALGEFSWKIEGMLNRVLDGSRPASPAVLAMVQHAFVVLPQLNAALRGQQPVSADLAALQDAADRIAAGEDVFVDDGLHGLASPQPADDATDAVLPVAVQDAGDAGTPASVDSVLREILEAEVAAHLETVDAWIASARLAPTAASEALLRSMHTMNGAFAMTDVPEITLATDPAETYIKRSLANERIPDADGVEALSDTADAIRACVAALATDAPRIARQPGLVARLHALADALPDMRWPPAFQDDELDLDVGQDLERELEAGDGLDVADDLSAYLSEDALAAAPGGVPAPYAGIGTPLPVEPPSGFDVAAQDAPAGAAPTDEEHRTPDAGAHDDGLDALSIADDALPPAEDLSADPTWAPVVEPASAAGQTEDAAGAAGLDADIDAWAAALDASDAALSLDIALDTVTADQADDAAGDASADSHDPPSLLHDDVPALPAQPLDDIVLDGDAAETAADEQPFALPADDGVLHDDLAGQPALPQDEIVLEHGQGESVLAASSTDETDDVDDALPTLRDDLQDGSASVVDEDDALALDADGLAAGDAAVPVHDAAPPALPQDDSVLPDEQRDVAQSATPAGEVSDEAALSWVDDLDVDVAVDDATTDAQSAGDAADVPVEVTLQSGLDDADAADQTPVVPAGVPAAAAVPAARAPVRMLDFTELDRELVDIFVEEAGDLLDHIDHQLHALREDPSAHEPVIELQRDLHTLKGGARMAGIATIGDLGHVIESLLEAIAGNRTELLRDDIDLLESGFDALHQLLVSTRAHQATDMPSALIAAFEARIRGELPTPVVLAPIETAEAYVAELSAPAQPAPATPVSDAVVPVPALAATAVPAGIALSPLSAPVEDEVVAVSSEDAARAPQEQVRVRADLLDNLVNHAGEVAIYRSRLEQQLGAFRGAMGELDRTNARLRDQLRRLDLETEAQIVARYQREQDNTEQAFDPLELDRFSTLQQLSRALNESAADLTGLQGVLDDLSRQYDVLLQQQSRVSSDLQDGLMSARMVPFDSIVPRLRRVVRQAGHDTGKQVQLRLDGTHGELDRNVLDRMVAPLEHMLRNSVAHGLETATDRRAAGKGEEGTITIALRHEGSEIVLQVADDGRGLDRAAIRRRAEQRGLVRADAVLSEAELDSVIFESGFSTVDQVSQLAGRGVGMDVVRNEVRQLGGTAEIESSPGRGATFTLRLPQTLAVTQAVFVQIGETTFAVPVASVSGIGRIARDRFEARDGAYRYAGEEYALHDLGVLVGQAPARAEGQEQMPLLLVRAGDLRAAVAIDQVLGNREIVVKPVGLQISSVPGIYGATITGDGRVMVILDVAPLVRRHLAQPARPVAEAAPVQQRHVPLVMVVDDSLTMRKVTGRVLERHNLEVVVARDGVEALEKLDERVPDLMLLDIEMPRMDGYELATAMRGDPRYRDVPIVMITSRTGEKHRQRAFEIGVQRYLGKPYQELDLMRNVYDLLGIARVRD